MKRMMGVVLVGSLDEQRHVCWGSALLLGCVLGIFCAAVAAGVYFALAGQFSLLATVIGFIGPFITIGAGIQNALRLPLEQLAPLDPPSA